MCFQDELEQLRNRVDKLEQERSQLKTDNDRLEQRVSVQNLCPRGEKRNGFFSKHFYTRLVLLRYIIACALGWNKMLYENKWKSNSY